MSTSARSVIDEDNVSMQYVDVVVERCIERGRVAFKDGPHMSSLIKLEDFPSFLFDDWVAAKVLVPDYELLGQDTVEKPSAEQQQGWLAYGTQWTYDTTVSWGKWIFRYETADSAKETESVEKPPPKGVDQGPAKRYVFLPALKAMGNIISQHIVEKSPMIDTVLTSEEWADLILSLGFLDGPMLTAYLLSRDRPKFVSLGDDENGGMLFTTSDRPEIDDAMKILHAKRLLEQMTAYIKNCETTVTEAQEFRREGEDPDTSERLKVESAEEALRKNQLFQIQLSKTMKRLREQKTMCVSDIAAAIDADCLSHFPGPWPRTAAAEEEEMCV